MRRLALIVLSAALTAAVHKAMAEPFVRAGTSYYYIEGASALVLSEQMQQKGPVGADGIRHPARTKWEVQWKFRHSMQDGGCKIDEAVVAVGITTVRPRWRGESKGPVSLKARWKQLDGAIDRGVAFHSQQADNAGREIEAALTALKPEKSCADLTAAANEVASQILKRHQAASEAYDRRTDYGRKDGARLI